MNGSREPGQEGGGSVDVEISIVNHENRDLLADCLRSIPEACGALRRRVTVVDNVSTDASIDMLAREFPDVSVVANRARMGFGANHNQVIGRLLTDRSARHVLVLNDDTTLDPGAVSLMVATMDADPALGAVGPTILGPDRSAQVSRLAYPAVPSALLHDLGRRYTEVPDPAGWLQGCCLLLRVQALAAVGGFDERFFLFYEDCDLSRRLVDGGWGLAVCPDAAVLHVGHASVLRGGFAHLTPRQGQRSRYLYLAKHVGPRRARLASLVGRVLLAGRAAGLGLRSLRPGAGTGADRADRDRDRHRAAALAGLARLDPRRPLPHEPAALAPPSAPAPDPAPAGAESP